MAKTALDREMEGSGWRKYTEINGFKGAIINGIELIETMRANRIPFQVRSDPEVPSTSIRSLYIRAADYDIVREIVDRHSEFG